MRDDLQKHGVLNECGGSREAQVGHAGYVLASDVTGEMRKRRFCGKSYIPCKEDRESFCK